MPRRSSAAVAAVLSIAVAAGAAARGQAGKAGDEARAVADKVTAAGAAMFDARDAKGLAATYAADARLEIISREEGAATLKTETRVGRADIQAYYDELFKGEGSIHARNTVEHARLIDPELLTIQGVFEPNAENAQALKLPFLQVRARQGGAWKIVSLQVFVVTQK